MEAVGNLAGGIAHEFNNMLSIIIGNTELALNEIEKRHPLHQNLSEIKSAGLRARDVVKQLLNFSRKVDTYMEPIDIRLIVKETLKLLKATIPSNIEIQAFLPDELDAVMADSTQIHQLLINLCNNASQAMSDEGGTLKIELSNVTFDYEKASKLRGLAPGAYVRLGISDTGSGIPQELLDKIFDPYFTTKDVGKGTGMGLAVVHGIVKTHNGSIFVDSEHRKGTVFHVYFPSSTKAVSEVTKRDEGIPTGKEKIIFVDDELSIVDLYRSMLERLGYSVISETDPLLVVERFQSNPLDYDLVISDMTMPNLTGDRLAEKLIKIRPDIPIIVCTGFSEKMSPEKAREIGIREVLMKPVGMKDLGNLIRKLLDEGESDKFNQRRV
jgi:CheY-like chemotaxis protein